METNNEKIYTEKIDDMDLAEFDSRLKNGDIIGKNIPGVDDPSITYYKKVNFRNKPMYIYTAGNGKVTLLDRQSGYLWFVPMSYFSKTHDAFNETYSKLKKIVKEEISKITE